MRDQKKPPRGFITSEIAVLAEPGFVQGLLDRVGGVLGEQENSIEDIRTTIKQGAVDGNLPAGPANRALKWIDRIEADYVD